MDKALRKLYFSCVSALLVFVTTIASTYAWLATPSVHVIDEFEIKYDSNSFEGLELSLDGVNYYSYITSKMVMGAILDEKGIVYNSNNIDKIFREFIVSKGSTAKISGSDIGFYDLDGNPSNNYISFPLYIRPTYIVGPDDIPESGIYNSNHAVNVFMDNNILNSKYVNSCLVNKYDHPLFGEINKFSINPVNAMRYAIKRYDIINKGDNYTSSSSATISIYNPGGDQSSRDINTNTYNFGGILSDSYNVALQDYNDRLNTNYSVPADAIGRGDLLVSSKYNHLIDLNDGFSIDKYVKFEFYFWYEGWDSDCLEAVGFADVAMSLSFSTNEYDV